MGSSSVPDQVAFPTIPWKSPLPFPAALEHRGSLDTRPGHQPVEGELKGALSQPGTGVAANPTETRPMRLTASLRVIWLSDQTNARRGATLVFSCCSDGPLGELS